MVGFVFNGGGSGSSQPGTLDYTELTNKPSIHAVTLTGDLTLADIGAAAASDIPTKVSQLTNDSEFITSSAIADKQDKLTAGDNITISEDNVISASGGDGVSVDTLTNTSLLAEALKINDTTYGIKPAFIIPGDVIVKKLRFYFESVGDGMEVGAVMLSKEKDNNDDLFQYTNTTITTTGSNYGDGPITNLINNTPNPRVGWNNNEATVTITFDDNYLWNTAEFPYLKIYHGRDISSTSRALKKFGIEYSLDEVNFKTLCPVTELLKDPVKLELAATLKASDYITENGFTNDIYSAIVKYDNGKSQLTSTTVQDAIDELKENNKDFEPEEINYTAWQAMSEEEKNNGNYLITDYPIKEQITKIDYDDYMELPIEERKNGEYLVADYPVPEEKEKQDKLTAGDNITITEDSVISAANPITQLHYEEYMNLPEEEQNTGIYIVDNCPGTSPSMPKGITFDLNESTGNLNYRKDGKIFYEQDVTTPLVPQMTDYTEPSGEVFYDVTLWDSNSLPWKLFDRNFTKAEDASGSRTTSSADTYIGYDFITPKRVIKYYLMDEVATAMFPSYWKIEASNDKEEWTMIHEVTRTVTPANGTVNYYYIEKENQDYYRYYRIFVPKDIKPMSGSSVSDGWSIQALQFFGLMNE